MRVEVPAVRVDDGITNNLSLRYTSDSGDFTQCRDGQATIASAALHMTRPAGEAPVAVSGAPRRDGGGV